MQECYKAIGGNYEAVLGRLHSEALIQRFTLKFLEDQSYLQLSLIHISIVKQLVEKMGGTITVESKLGEGSCFTVILPFKIDTNARPEEKEDFDADISDIRVLLVDDNELNVEIAEFMLTENGAKVETVNNGLEAVQHFEASEPGTYDVILMDVMMPVMDGLTATKTIRSLERQDAKTTVSYTHLDVYKRQDYESRHDHTWRQNRVREKIVI